MKENGNMIDIINKIEIEHHEIRKRLDTMKQFGVHQWEIREKIFSEIKKVVRPHMKAEEQIIYPMLFSDDASLKNAYLFLEEHHFMERLFNEMDDMSKQSDYWGAKEHLLTEFINNHFSKEEIEFKEIIQHISKQTIELLGDRYVDEEEKIRTIMAQRATHP